ncbi:PEP-CTERM protein-sorting domain-containing protein [Terrimicrobium sacchariphilum]|uniref:PEP-CTERM protein-sorting domain-containing protein n=1 Tax=Terrimicrobium sacchariphilum TaxID=690879 RepID=A0A146G5Y6_TERSA|nr:PEP-CTERM protein-sorting domain-containing protein [Terrimicrobium sacchariphilum]
MNTMLPSVTKVLAFTLTLAFAAVIPASAGSLITNGNLEAWGAVSGTPPQGSPTGWAGGGTVIRSAGLVPGSTYSGVIQAGNSGLYTTALLESTAQFELSFVLAATDPGSATSRSFNLQLSQASGMFLNFRTVRGSSGAGFLTLQVYDIAASGWSNLVQNLDASVYTGGSTNSFTTLNPYAFTLDVNLTGTPSWSLSYGAVGGSITTLSNKTIFSANPTVGGALTQFGFAGGASASNYGVDNITAISVPEPGTAVLALVGGFLLVAKLRRKM